MKIAFIVQNNWALEHFGVRNLFISCFKILQQHGIDVDFIRFEQKMDKILWYRDFISDSDCKSSVQLTTVGTRKKYKKLTKKQKSIPRIYSQFIGENIKDSYDAFVITNPWLIEHAIDTGGKKTILICYDCNANIYKMVGIMDDPVWGFMHNTGYQFSKKINAHFLSISAKTDCEIRDFYGPENHSYLPPVPTYAFFDIEYDKNTVKENAVILAAPFDLRKGLRDIPKILNRLKYDFDTLYIYGLPRCGRKEYNRFYKELKFKNVIHYDKITSDDLINLYRKSKFLLFPSREEGLGMPIIEAQLAGCRVVTTDKPPMNELLCDGNYLLKNSEEDIVNLRKMLKEDFDYENLHKSAKEKFSTEAIYQTFMDILTEE